MFLHFKVVYDFFCFFQFLDDLMGWQDLILKELERKQLAEQNMFLDLLQDPSLEENKCDSRNINRDQRNKRLNELLMKRKELNLQDQSEKV